MPIKLRLRRVIARHPKDGLVISANWQRVWPRLRKAAGITALYVADYPFASYYLAVRCSSDIIGKR